MTGRVERACQAGLWLRDTGLGAVGYALVTVVAVAGWWASFVGLHAFATAHMGLSDHEGWLVPLTFDGAALGLTVCVARAAMHGRGALVWRGLVVAFTGLSAWINYTHIDDPRGRLVAALLPISAVTVFEALMGEARAAYERRSGRVRPRIHPLRWVFDWTGTWAIVRAYVLDIPMPDRYTPTPAPTSNTTGAQDSASQAPTNTTDTPSAGARDNAPDTPANRVRRRPRKPRTGTRGTAGRVLYADYLTAARQALTPDTTVTPLWVRQQTGCSRGTATRVAAELTATAHQSDSGDSDGQQAA